MVQVLVSGCHGREGVAGASQMMVDEKQKRAVAG